MSKQINYDELDGLLCEVCNRAEATQATEYGYFCDKCYDLMIDDLSTLGRHAGQQAPHTKAATGDGTAGKDTKSAKKEHYNRRRANRDRYQQY